MPRCANSALNPLHSSTQWVKSAEIQLRNWFNSDQEACGSSRQHEESPWSQHSDPRARLLSDPSKGSVLDANCRLIQSWPAGSVPLLRDPCRHLWTQPDPMGRLIQAIHSDSRLPDVQSNGTRDLEPRRILLSSNLSGFSDFNSSVHLDLRRLWDAVWLEGEAVRLHSDQSKWSSEWLHHRSITHSPDIELHESDLDISQRHLLSANAVDPLESNPQAPSLTATHADGSFTDEETKSRNRAGTRRANGTQLGSWIHRDYWKNQVQTFFALNFSIRINKFVKLSSLFIRAGRDFVGRSVWRVLVAANKWNDEQKRHRK